MEGGGRSSTAKYSCYLLLAVVYLQQLDLKGECPRLLEFLDGFVELEEEDFLEFHLRGEGSTCAPDLRGKALLRKHCSSNSVLLSLRAASFSMRLTGVAWMGWGRACAARERRRA